ncbi:unnamed protein product, partial [Nesidiocoris tenuis]
MGPRSASYLKPSDKIYDQVYFNLPLHKSSLQRLRSLPPYPVQSYQIHNLFPSRVPTTNSCIQDRKRDGGYAPKEKLLGLINRALGDLPNLPPSDWRGSLSVVFPSATKLVVYFSTALQLQTSTDRKRKYSSFVFPIASHRIHLEQLQIPAPQFRRNNRAFERIKMIERSDESFVQVEKFGKEFSPWWYMILLLWRLSYADRRFNSMKFDAGFTIPA